MHRVVLLAVLVFVAGCESTSEISRHTLDKLYVDTALESGALSSVPKQIEIDESTVVVNWWYAGSRKTDHVLVYRKLKWDANGKPIGEEKRYRINQTALTIDAPFAYTQDASRWLPLYEAAPGRIQPPADLPTTRQRPNPVVTDPIALPSRPAQPAAPRDE